MWKIELMGQILAQQYNIVVNIWISSRKKCGYLVLPVCWHSFASQKQTSGPKWSQLSCYLRKLGHAHSHKNGTCRWTPTSKTRDSNFGNHRFQAPSFVLDHVFFGVFSFVRFWTFSDLKFHTPAGVRGSATNADPCLRDCRSTWVRSLRMVWDDVKLQVPSLLCWGIVGNQSIHIYIYIRGLQFLKHLEFSSDAVCELSYKNLIFLAYFWRNSQFSSLTWVGPFTTAAAPTVFWVPGGSHMRLHDAENLLLSCRSRIHKNRPNFQQNTCWDYWKLVHSKTFYHQCNKQLGK